jgi:hypothetical protein
MTDFGNRRILAQPRSAGGLIEGPRWFIVIHEIWPIGFFGLVAAALALAAYRRRPDRLLP